MPSTYSPSLRIELIGDGEQDGIWGQTTNNNLGDLVEQAIAGITTVDVTVSNVVLTSFNGASDEARSAVLSVIGTPGTTRIITIPNVPKNYIVQNSTTDIVQIKTVSGTAFSCPPSSHSYINCNASNVVVGRSITTQANAITSSSAPFNSPAFTGVPTAPTAAPGTNTTQIATTAFTTAAIALIPTPTTVIPPGSKMLFQQTTAPTGWTKITTFDNAALRVVSGAASSGGVTDFSTVFSASGVASNSIALTTAQMPSHNHSLSPNFNVNFSQALFDPGGLGFLTSGAGGPNFSISNTGSSDTHYHTTTLNLKYVDIIIASKD